MSREKLLTIYELYAAWAEKFDFACRQGCSTCCTQSVSMTTLEGELIHAYISSERQELMGILQDLPESASYPKTTNQFAAACLREEEDEEAPDSWDLSPCVFLHDNSCSIYPVRSFMCRSFGSKVPCGLRGEAEIEPLFLSLNTIVLQCIEHLDRGRPWGNMNTILRMLKDYNSGEPCRQKENVRIAEPVPGFLLPPDEEAALHNQLQSLLSIIGRV